MTIGQIIAAAAVAGFWTWLIVAGFRTVRRPWDASDVKWEPSRNGRILAADIYDNRHVRVMRRPFDWERD